MISPEELGLEVFGYNGDEAKVRCPYHSDSRPSAEFNVRTGLFYCFSCGTGSSAKDIAKEFGGVINDHPTKRKGFDVPIIDWRTRFLGGPVGVHSEYLASRKVPLAAIWKLQIKTCENGIVFPLFGSPEGDICGVQVRYLDGRDSKYVFYGTRPSIYPLTLFPGEGDAFLVEGVFSVIRGRDAGFNVFAVMGAGSLMPALKFFFDRTRVFGIFDSDAAGYIAAAKLASIGIACLKIPFEADEKSTKEWRDIISNKMNFSMDVGFFAGMAIRASGKRDTVAKQILKFEKEHK